MQINHSIAVPIIVSLIAGGSYVYGQKVQTRYQDMITISADGEGKVSAAPDIAQLSFGVQTGRQGSAQKAMDMLSTKMASIIEAVKKEGVEEKDISTASFWLSPAYDYNEGKQIPRGFEASQQLTVKVRDLDKVASVLNAAVKKGANQAGGVNFTIDKPEQLRAQARAEAIQEAKEKAAVLAKQLGKSLGDLRGYNEGGMGSPMMYRAMEMSMDSAMGGVAAPVPSLPAGEQEVVVSVSLTYELK